MNVSTIQTDAMCYHCTERKAEVIVSNLQMCKECVSSLVKRGLESPEKILEKVLKMLETQKFASWYETDFLEYIEESGDKKQILEDIERLMKL